MYAPKLHFLRLAVSAALLLPSPALAARSSLLPFEIPATPIEDWQPTAMDVFVVDTKQNIGYLVHQDSGYTSFPVVTGQRKIVRYIGRTYDATTPTHSWKALTRETKDDRITFGKRGTFFRLFRSADDQTSYGIHSHAYAAKMLGQIERFRSMGCIIVSDSVLDIIGATFDKEEGALPVLTVFGFGDDSVTYPLLAQMIGDREKAL